MALITMFELELLYWGNQPPELSGPNGTNNRGSLHVVFSQSPTTDESFIMNGKTLFTIHNPNNKIVL